MLFSGYCKVTLTLQVCTVFVSSLLLHDKTSNAKNAAKNELIKIVLRYIIAYLLVNEFFSL